MKKRIGLLIAVLAMVLGLAGCTSKTEPVEYDEATIEQATEFVIEYCNSVDQETIDAWNSRTDFAVETELYNSGLPFTPESFLGALDSWQSGIDECGAYIEHGDFTYEAEADGLTVTVPAKFEEREANLEFIYDENLYLDSMTVSGIYSTGEILEKAGLNTVLGMGTVFCVLIFISIIIWLLKFIPAIEQFFRGRKAKEAPVQAEKEEVVQAVPETVDLTDDLELVAVISAAIAAAEGTSTDGFVVRSICRRPSNKWKA